MNEIGRMIGGCLLIFMCQWMVRWAVRAELERAGIKRPIRIPTEAEMGQVMVAMAEGKLNKAEALYKKFTNGHTPFLDVL